MKKLILILLVSTSCFACNQPTTNSDILITEDQSEVTKETQPDNLAERKITVFTTAKNSNLRLSKTDEKSFEKAQQPLESEISVFVNPGKKFQQVLGIGGAITDASAEVLSKLPQVTQKKLIEAYFSKENGIGYSIIRTSIHSCDFSPYSFTYIEEGDKELKSFNIKHDLEFRIPIIKEAIKTASNKVTFYASPWSPPAFMKSNNNMLQGGKLLPEYYQTWANYYVKFIEAYEAQGIDIWGVTMQNEPMAVQRWESCIYTAEEERDFLKNYLGPTFEKNGLRSKKIVVWDHNRDLIVNRANTIFGDPIAAKYAWGIGFHWYENWSGGEPMFDNLKVVKDAFPDKELLFTEGCNERFDNTKYEHWPNAERYGKSMINDFNNGTVGWTDWNILLDQFGGPNHVGNLCFAPVHADLESKELIFTPSYYYIGHFSKFVSPNDYRISSASSRSQLLTTSFIDEDGKISTIVMNQSAESVNYKLFVGEMSAEITIPANAMQTLVF